MKTLKIFQSCAILSSIGACAMTAVLCALAMLYANDLQGQRNSRVCEKRGCSLPSAAKKRPNVARFNDPEVGQLYFSIGAGLIPLYVKNRGSTIDLPLDGALDYMLSDRFSTGVIVGRQKVQAPLNLASARELRNMRWTNEMWYTSARATFHSRTFSCWNFYGGVSVGLYHNSLTPSNADERTRRLEEISGLKRQSRTFAYAGFVGARCNLNGRTAAFSELGISNSLLRAGISHRFI